MINTSQQAAERRSKFLELIKEGNNIGQACGILKITRQTYYSYRHNVAGFADEVDALLEGRPTASQLQSTQTKTDLLEALTKYKGIVTDACNAVGITRPWYYQLLDGDPEFAKAVKDIQEQVTDFVETQLYQQIAKGNHISTIFYLKTRGKHRGYTEQIALTGADGGAIQVRVIEPFVDPLSDVPQLQDGEGNVVEAEYTVLEPA